MFSERQLSGVDSLRFLSGLPVRRAANRFLWDHYGDQPIFGSNLNGWNFAQTVASDYGVGLVGNGTANQPYLPGDIVSFTGNVGTPVAGDGHVAIVTGSTEDSSGNGSVTLLQQNSAYGAVETLTVSNWSLRMPSGSWVTPYQFDAFASGGGGNAPPTTPTSLSAAGDLVNEVVLSWAQSTGGVGGVSGYDIYRNGVQIGSTSGSSSTTFVDSSFAQGTSYFYEVSAFDSTSQQSVPSAEIPVVTHELPDGRADLASQFGSTYCRQVGGPNNVASYLKCTVFNGSTWTTSMSGLEDWGNAIGASWLSDNGNPTYCRQVGGPNNVASYLKCTVFNGSTWITSQSGQEDWGTSTGWAWLTDNGNPTYCRQVGGPNNVASYLECTVFNGSTWTTSMSGLEDWGTSTGYGVADRQRQPDLLPSGRWTEQRRQLPQVHGVQRVHVDHLPVRAGGLGHKHRMGVADRQRQPDLLPSGRWAEQRRQLPRVHGVQRVHLDHFDVRARRLGQRDRCFLAVE